MPQERLANKAEGGGTGRDDVAALRQEVATLRAELKHAHRLTLLGTLAGSIVHEFNNILTPILSYADMAIESPQDAALTRKALERARHGADRASQIAASILAFAGTDPQPTGSVDVAAAVRDAMTCLARDPSKDRVAVEISVAPACRAAIDHVGLQQVVLNLVINAIRAMRPRGGRLSIRATEQRSTWNIGSPRPAVVLEVEDTGCGIEPERLPKLFTPFASSRSGGGTGLGLTICKQLVERAGGAITVRSKLGSGTCFSLLLPSAVESPAAAA